MRGGKNMNHKVNNMKSMRKEENNDEEKQNKHKADTEELKRKIEK